MNARPFDYRNGDVVLGEHGNLFKAEYDRFARRIEWVPLLPIGASQPNPPEGAVLVCRVVEGKVHPVTDFGDAGLFAVRTTA